MVAVFFLRILGSIPRAPFALRPFGSNPSGLWVRFDPKACAKPMRKGLLIGFDPKDLTAFAYEIGFDPKATICAKPVGIEPK